jgi:hypothetical protein
MVAEVAHLLARDAAPERIRALIRTTISEIEATFATIGRLQKPCTRLPLPYRSWKAVLSGYHPGLAGRRRVYAAN